MATHEKTSCARCTKMTTRLFQRVNPKSWLSILACSSFLSLSPPLFRITGFPLFRPFPPLRLPPKFRWGLLTIRSLNSSRSIHSIHWNHNNSCNSFSSLTLTPHSGHLSQNQKLSPAPSPIFSPPTSLAPSSRLLLGPDARLAAGCQISSGRYGSLCIATNPWTAWNSMANMEPHEFYGMP